jgi:hypothetical protein
LATVLVYSDNMVTVQSLNKKYSKSEELRGVLAQILGWCQNEKVEIEARHLAGKENSLADDLSRRIDWDDWMLSKEIFNQIEQKFGKMEVDCMASDLSHQVEKFYSQGIQRKSQGVDAFTCHWGGKNCWVFPPFNLIARVLRHMWECKAHGVLLVPLWTSQVWWPFLCKHAIQAWPLPRTPNLLFHYVKGWSDLLDYDLVAIKVEF